MTDSEIADYYANLLIIQYKGKPKAISTIKAMAMQMIIGQLPMKVSQAYDVTTSVGAQLDIIGKYVGVTRKGNNFTGPVVLDDNDFRKLIQLAIIKNTSGSSLYEIQNLLNQYFAGVIVAFDFKDMRMCYYFNSTTTSPDLAQLFITEGLLPVPMGVGIGTVIYYPVLNKFFGFRTYKLPAQNVSPFNTYADYHNDWPWLSYSMAIGAVVSPAANLSSLLTESGDRIVQEDGSLLYM